MNSDAKELAIGCLPTLTGFVFGFFPIVAGVACFFAGPELAENAYGILSSIFVLLLIISVVLIPFAFFKVLRLYVGIAYVTFSMPAAALLSILAINMIAYHWGQHWVLLGLLGPGLPFFALIADIFNLDWAGICYLLFCFIVTVGWRVGGTMMASAE